MRALVCERCDIVCEHQEAVARHRESGGQRDVVMSEEERVICGDAESRG